MIPCEVIRPLLFASLEDEVTAEERNQVTTHVAVCEECYEALRSERALTRFLLTPTTSNRAWFGYSVVAALLVVFMTSYLVWPNSRAYGSIESMGLLPTLSSGAEERRLEESNHVDIPSGVTATVEIYDIGTIHTVGPAVFELDHTFDGWKLTLHRGRLRVTVLESRELHAASVHGTRVLSAGLNVVEPTAERFSHSGPQDRSATKQYAAALEHFFASDQMDLASEGFRAVSADPLASEELRSDALFYLIACRSNQGEHSQVVRLAHEWLEVNDRAEEGTATILYALGEAYYQTDQAAKGRECFEQLLENHGETPYGPYASRYLRDSQD